MMKLFHGWNDHSEDLRVHELSEQEAALKIQALFKKKPLHPDGESPAAQLDCDHPQVQDISNLNTRGMPYAHELHIYA